MTVRIQQSLGTGDHRSAVSIVEQESQGEVFEIDRVVEAQVEVGVVVSYGNGFTRCEHGATFVVYQRTALLIPLPTHSKHVSVASSDFCQNQHLPVIGKHSGSNLVRQPDYRVVVLRKIEGGIPCEIIGFDRHHIHGNLYSVVIDHTGIDILAAE